MKIIKSLQHLKRLNVHAVSNLHWKKRAQLQTLNLWFKTSQKYVVESSCEPPPELGLLMTLTEEEDAADAVDNGEDEEEMQGAN